MHSGEDHERNTFLKKEALEVKILANKCNMIDFDEWLMIPKLILRRDSNGST